jgi:O-methyltransferase involved in polyketide biosynthesis
MAQPEQNLPEFNRSGEDKMALGHTPSTRSAELVAGARAILMNTDETIALSKMSGRIVSRFLTDIDRKLNVMWFFPARMMAIEALTKEQFPEDKVGLLFVDIASGFSPRGLHMALQYPKALVVEVDLPEVVVEKQRRLEKGKIAIPPNLTWIGTDLGKANLSEVLEGRKADLITCEGLTLYLTPAENSRLFKQVSSSLKPGGVVMVEIYFKDKLQHLRQNPNVNSVASFVFRMVGSVPGIMPDFATATKIVTEAGLAEVSEHPVAAMMEVMGQPAPLDVISILLANKPAITEWIGIAPTQEMEKVAVKVENTVPDANAVKVETITPEVIPVKIENPAPEVKPPSPTPTIGI